MALTLVDDGRLSIGNARALVYTYTGPASYATDGDSFTPALVGLKDIHAIVPCGNPSDGSAVRLLEWDRTNKKLVWYVPNTGSEVANATNLSTFSCRLLVVGK